MAADLRVVPADHRVTPPAHRERMHGHLRAGPRERHLAELSERDRAPCLHVLRQEHQPVHHEHLAVERSRGWCRRSRDQRAATSSETSAWIVKLSPSVRSSRPPRRRRTITFTAPPFTGSFLTATCTSSARLDGHEERPDARRRGRPQRRTTTCLSAATSSTYIPADDVTCRTATVDDHDGDPSERDGRDALHAHGGRERRNGLYTFTSAAEPCRRASVSSASGSDQRDSDDGGDLHLHGDGD